MAVADKGPVKAKVPPTLTGVPEGAAKAEVPMAKAAMAVKANTLRREEDTKFVMFYSSGFQRTSYSENAGKQSA
jgi:hypothetical protein